MPNREQGVEVHYLRSLARFGVYAICGRVVLDGRYTTIWEQVTCGNCKLSRPKWERNHRERQEQGQ